MMCNSVNSVKLNHVKKKKRIQYSRHMTHVEHNKNK